MRILRLLPLLALVAACSDVAGPGARSVQLTTQVNDDAPPNEPNLQVTVENRGSRTVRMMRCGERVVLMIDRRENGRWEEYNGDVCITAVVQDPLELAPGANADRSLELREPGRYRLRLSTWYPDDAETRRTVTSAPFDIE